MLKKSFVLALFLSTSLILPSAAIASGATYYVSSMGEDSSSGLSAEMPFKNIQKAVDIAQAGDTIILAPGEYKQDIISRRDGTASAPITITGPSNAVVKGGGNDRVIEINHDYYTLSGFTVDGLYGSSANSSSYRDILVFVHGKESRNGITGFKAMNMTLQNAGGECLRLRYFVTQAEIAYNTISNCGVFDFVFNAGGKNGEGIYIGTSNKQWGDGKNPTSDPDETRDNIIHHNTIDTQGNECVDIKEGATANIVEYNTCRGQKDDESGGFDSRGDKNIFRFNDVKGSVGAGIRLGGWLVGGIQYGKNNDVYGNTIENNKGGGVKFQVSPQGKICGNTLSENIGGDSAGIYASSFNPAKPCDGNTPASSTPPAILPPVLPPIVTPPPRIPALPATGSLANNNTLTAHSNNFSLGYEPAKLWDGCYEGVLYDSTICTAGGRDILSFWLEFDFKKPYILSQARLYGDAEGTWVSKSWAMSYKQNAADNWTAVFSGEQALFNGWSTRSLDITARYMRVEILGSEKYSPGRTQAREFEIYGVETELPQKAIPSGAQSGSSPHSQSSQSSSSFSSGGQSILSFDNQSPNGFSPSLSSQQALIEQLNARIAELKERISVLKTSCIFSRYLSIGLTGEDVRCLQRFLNATGFPVSLAGPGSSHNETSYFGLFTKQAVIAWQNVNASVILAPLGLTAGTGYWGASSISHYKKTIAR